MRKIGTTALALVLAAGCAPQADGYDGLYVLSLSDGRILFTLPWRR